MLSDDSEGLCRSTIKWYAPATNKSVQREHFAVSEVEHQSPRIYPGLFIALTEVHKIRNALQIITGTADQIQSYEAMKIRQEVRVISSILSQVVSGK